MIKHILIRLCVLFIVPLFISIMFELSGTSDAMGSGMARGFYVIATFLASAILLTIGFIVDTIILYRKKQQGKVIFNITLFLSFLTLSVLLFQNEIYDVLSFLNEIINEIINEFL